MGIHNPNPSSKIGVLAFTNTVVGTLHEMLVS